MRNSLYFEAVGKLGALAREAVGVLCGGGRGIRRPDSRTLKDIAADADMTAGRLMSAISSDFITPLGRGDMAAAVLSLRRVVALARELSLSEPAPRAGGAAPPAEQACLTLAVTAERFARQLGEIKKKGAMPSAAVYFEAARIPPPRRGGEAGGRPAAGLEALCDCLCDCCEKLIIAALNNI